MPGVPDALEEGSGKARRSGRWGLRRLLALIPLVLLLLLVLFLLTPTGCYLGRAGWEEARILVARQPIASLVRDPDLDEVTRGKLQVVLEARDFAADSIGLDAGKSFTQYTALDRDTLILVVSAAPRDELRFHTWWFPVVGRVPYKGFFDFDAAHREASRLEARGYDTNLRPVSAFSTLGFFNDPLLSTTLRADSIDLVNTVIHELTHNTFYARGQAVFNESFANFVGSRGAEWFFRSRGDSAAVRRTIDDWADQRLLAAFWGRVYRSLDSAFTAHADDVGARLEARDTIYAKARRELTADVAPRFLTIDPRYAERVKLDNASLLARRVYMTDLTLYDRVLEREGGNLRAAIRRVIELAESDRSDPFGAVRRWLGEDSAVVEAGT